MNVSDLNLINLINKVDHLEVLISHKQTQKVLK